MFIRKDYTIIQKSVIATLLAINFLFFIKFSWMLFTLFKNYMVGASNIALDQIESITCVYSSVVSLYLVIRSLVIKCCLYLHPIRLSKQIAAHIFKWRIVWERLRGTEVEYESVESVVNQLNTDIVGWINPLEIFLFTVIHGILYMTINALLETNWCLNAICVGIVGFLVIPMSIGITLTSIITQKNVFDPEQILK